MSCRTSRSRRFFLVCSLVALAAMAAVPAFAQFTDPTTVFEAGDANSFTGDSLTPGCDWNTLNAGGNTFNSSITNNSLTPVATCAGDAATGPNAYSFLVGSINEKNFTGGGSKDPQPISNWKWTEGSTPDKDTLTHGYAASYTSSIGHKILVFGAERFAENGDSNIGVWFFHQPVGPTCPANNANCTKNGFSGAHTNGDLLAISAFTNGGSHPALDVLEWDDSCSNANYPSPAAVGACAATNLREKFSGSGGQLCNSSSPGCASTNAGGPITLAWPYTAKFGGGNANTVGAAGFFEGGVDLTAIFGAAAQGCFSSFLVETRSSQSPSAVLKDFLAGSFPECAFTIAKSCACTAVNGNTGEFTYTYGGTVTNSTNTPLYNVTITDTLPTSPATTQTYVCPTLGGNATLNWPSADCPPSSPNSFISTSKGLTNSASATAQTSNSSNASTIDATNNPATATCLNDATSTPVCVPTPGITVTKVCSTALSATNNDVHVVVNYTGTVKNDNGTEALVNVAVNDTNGTDSGGGGGTADTNNPLSLTGCTSGNGKSSPCTLNTGVTASFSGSYVPSNGQFLDSSGNPIPGRALFFDKVVGTGTGKVSGTNVSDNHVAHCAVCPFGACEAQ